MSAVESRARDRPVSAPLGRRLASLSYEALLLAAVLWCAALPLAVIEHQLSLVHIRPMYQLYLAAVAAVYFTWQWARGGQTLAMKTWRLRLVTDRGASITTRRALLRYIAALASVALFALGFVWALIDRDGAFLHDRIAGTRIVSTRDA